MKKIFLLVGMLFISILTFGTNEGKIEVKATIIAPLTIQNPKAVDFGILVKGDKKKKAAQGSFEVKGEPGYIIDIFVRNDDGSYTQVKNHEEKYSVELKRVGGSGSANEKITATLNINPADGKFTDAGNVALPTLPEGTGDDKEVVRGFEVWGIIESVDENLKAGDYKGYLHVKAQYE